MVAATLCLLVSALSARADNEYALSVVSASGPYYVNDRWMPIRAMVSNRSNRDIRGHVVCPVRGEDGTVTFRIPVHVPANTSCTFVGNIYIPPQPQPTPRRRGEPAPQPPLCVAWLEDSSGAQLVRSELLGRLIRENEKERAAGAITIGRPLIIGVSDDLTAETDEEAVANNISEFAEQLQTTAGLPVFAQSMSPNDLSRSLAGYDMVGIVVLNRVNLQNLDAAQRQAMLDFMATGGTVILSAPRGSADPTGSWLAPYLPATYVGERFATSLTLNGATTRPVVPLDVAELVRTADAPAGSVVVASDDQYVHLAYTPVGFGRLVMSAFPITALDVENAAIRALWQQAVVPTETLLSWDRSRIPSEQGTILQSMVGLKAPPWTAAAMIVGAYVLVVLLIQLFARQSRRPAGFAAAIGVAIVVSGGLLVISLFKDKTVALNFARISVTDLSNGGVRQEAVALLGEHKDVTLVAVPGATIRDEVGGTNDITIITSPAGVRTTLQPRQLGHIWRASAAVPPEKSLRVSGQFDAEGLKLNVNNTAGPVTGALLLSGHRHFSLADLPAGQSTAVAADQNLNPAGSPPINQKAVQLEAEQLRGRIMDALMRSAPSSAPMVRLPIDSSLVLAGWFAEPPPPLVMLEGEEQTQFSRSNALVRAPVELQPSPVGSTVKISGAFTRVLNGFGATIPYDTNTNEWIEQFTAPQEFQIGFALPSGIGKLRPTRVTLVANFNAAQHTVTVRRGQCPGGKVALNSDGPEIATWNRPISAQRVTFEVSPGDYDANGWVWLSFNVDAGDIATARWQIHEMAMDYEATVEGPPTTPVLPDREAMRTVIDPPRNSPPAQPKQPQKKADDKKPQPKKPATTKQAANAKKDASKK